MLTLLPIILHEMFLPQARVHAIVTQAVGLAAPYLPRGVLPLDPIHSLFLMFALAYAVYGLKLSLMILDGSMFRIKNSEPRGDSNKALQSPIALRCQGCHENIMEGFVFFAAAVIVCMQAGVATSVLTDYCTLYCGLRFV